MTIRGAAQSDTSLYKIQNTAANIDTKLVGKLDEKYKSLQKDLNVKTADALKGFQKKEARLKKKLESIDSTKAKELFGQSEQFYKGLQNKLTSTNDKLTRLTHYFPGLDSLQTATKFLQQAGNSLSNYSPDKLNQLNQLSSSLNSVQNSMQSATEINQLLNQRQQQLQSALQQFGLSKELLGMNKQMYYYQQQLNEYKATLQDEEKLEQKAMSLVRELPAFKDFMSKNSFLSQLFPTPATGTGIGGTAQVLAGLQTRSFITQQLQQQMGTMATNSGGVSGMQVIQQNLQRAQQQISTIQNTVNQYLNGGNNSMIIPAFSPNSQKTKSFFKRFQFGWNLQSVAGIRPNPNTIVFGLSTGYKLSDKKVIGIGASYIMGTGTGGIDHIQLSNQGVGLRSNIDMKLKKSFWLTGGLEYNYMQMFSKFSAIPGVELWQKSALMGITKKFKAGKREGNLQLLYDFLAAQEVPTARSLIFRMGYSL